MPIACAARVLAVDFSRSGFSPHSKEVCVCLSQVRKAVTQAFAAADSYRETFDPFRAFYKVNETEDLDRMKKEEHG